MSVVAGKVYKDRIVVAADTQVTEYWHNKNECHKVWQVGDLIIGAVGLAAEAQLMRLFLDSHKPKSVTEHDLIEFFVEFFDYCIKRNKDFKPGNNYLVAYQGKLVNVYSDLSIFYREQDAIGSGMEYAKAALHLGKDPSAAVAVACDMTIYCSEPIDTYEVKI